MTITTAGCKLVKYNIHVSHCASAAALQGKAGAPFIFESLVKATPTYNLRRNPALNTYLFSVCARLASGSVTHFKERMTIYSSSFWLVRQKITLTKMAPYDRKKWGESNTRNNCVTVSVLFPGSTISTQRPTSSSGIRWARIEGPHRSAEL